MKSTHLRYGIAAVVVILSAWLAASLSAADWRDQLLAVPYPPVPAAEPPRGPSLRLVRQDFERLELNQSVIQTPLTIGARKFARGLGTHSVGRIVVESPQPMAKFQAQIGVDNNVRTAGKRGSVVFAVLADGRQVYRSEVVRGGEDARPLDLDLRGARALELHVDDAGDGPGWDHADWAEAKIVTADGQILWLDALPARTDTRLARYPFSFCYGGRHSDEVLVDWKCDSQVEAGAPGCSRKVTCWTDPKSGLHVEWHVTRFTDYPAAEWLLQFENIGQRDTPVLADVQAWDWSLHQPLAGESAYRLHRTNGAPSNPSDFEPTLVPLSPGSGQMMGGGGGRSSNRDFPFFKIEAADASYIVAVGWSGQWQARVSCRPDRRLHGTAGLEQTHFRLHPGERVRMPSILMLRWPGDTLESNAQFRQLIYQHYAARRNGQPVLPTLFCNTCFTRGGGWLNECHAANQISLIRAYAPLGLEALITDAGWFEGGWPAGAGNWTPRKEAYPQGMAPVAGAAKEHGMVYGLWFEFERVVAGTALEREHPDWLLRAGDGPQGTYLLDLGKPEVRQYLLQIVKGFMDLPGFRFYRSDFNMDPLPYWRHSDPPDRQGISELHYIAGLYAFWDQLAQAWPDAFREECASGGRRIDLETVKRMHFHQESDYWFDNQADLAQIWGLSQYLPNSVFTTPLIRLDDRSFHCTLATSLIPGWIADAPDFDRRRAKQLTDVYRQLRHLLVGAWYPLLPYSRDGKHWMAAQYQRPDLGEGLVLVVPPLASQERSVRLQLRGLESAATYRVHFQVSNRQVEFRGRDLMNAFEVTVPAGDGGERIVLLRQRSP
jgi:alpha-galactosidase